jgi:hypothetical protein
MAEMPRRLPRSWGLAALVAVAWRTLLVGGTVDVAVLLAGLRVLHVTEVDPRVARLRHR